MRLPVPNFLALAVAGLCDLLHLTPYGIGALELMWRDNLPRENLLISLLGRTPTPVGRELPAPRPAYAPSLTFVGRIRELLH